MATVSEHESPSDREVSGSVGSPHRATGRRRGLPLAMALALEGAAIVAGLIVVLRAYESANRDLRDLVELHVRTEVLQFGGIVALALVIAVMCGLASVVTALRSRTAGARLVLLAAMGLNAAGAVVAGFGLFNESNTEGEVLAFFVAGVAMIGMTRALFGAWRGSR